MILRLKKGRGNLVFWRRTSKSMNSKNTKILSTNIRTRMKNLIKIESQKESSGKNFHSQKRE